MKSETEATSDTPLVTPDELNKILTAQNADLRMREQVGKEAFDKLRAELDVWETRARERTTTCNELLSRAEKAEARLAAVLGALERIVALSATMPDEAEEVRIAREALDAARTGDASKSSPKTNTSEQSVNAVDASGDAAHPDSVKLAEILRLHTVAEAANDRHREACEAADGEGWANDPTGSMHLTELGRRANERWAEFVAALESAKAGAGVDVAAQSVEKGEEPEDILFFDKATDREMKLVNSGGWSGWLFYRHPDGAWVSSRKATEADRAAIDAARNGGAEPVKSAGPAQ